MVQLSLMRRPCSTHIIEKGANGGGVIFHDYPPRGNPKLREHDFRLRSCYFVLCILSKVKATKYPVSLKVAIGTGVKFDFKWRSCVREVSRGVRIIFFQGFLMTKNVKHKRLAGDFLWQKCVGMNECKSWMDGNQKASTILQDFKDITLWAPWKIPQVKKWVPQLKWHLHTFGINSIALKRRVVSSVIWNGRKWVKFWWLERLYLGKTLETLELTCKVNFSSYEFATLCPGSRTHIFIRISRWNRQKRVAHNFENCFQGVIKCPAMYLR